jgi:hypothetical protein
MKFPAFLRNFIDSEQWTFARTMPEWPHEYLVRDRLDGQLFEALVHHIRARGHEERCYQSTRIYFADDGLLYSTMSIGSSTALSAEAHDYATACQEAIEGTEPRLAPRLRPDGPTSRAPQTWRL